MPTARQEPEMPPMDWTARRDALDALLDPVIELRADIRAAEVWDGVELRARMYADPAVARQIFELVTDPAVGGLKREIAEALSEAFFSVIQARDFARKQIAREAKEAAR